MSNVSIIEGLARRRVVEKICDGVTKRPGSPDSQDLAQHVYQILLEKTTDLHGIENIEAFVNTIVFKQWNLVGSEFYRRYRDYGIRAQDIDETRAVRALQEGAEGLPSGLRTFSGGKRQGGDDTPAHGFAPDGDGADDVDFVR